MWYLSEQRWALSPCSTNSIAAGERQLHEPGFSSCSCLKLSSPRSNLSVGLAATNNAQAFHQICLQFPETQSAVLWWLRVHQGMEGEELNFSSSVNCFHLHVPVRSVRWHLLWVPRNSFFFFFFFAYNSRKLLCMLLILWLCFSVSVVFSETFLIFSLSCWWHQKRAFVSSHIVHLPPSVPWYAAVRKQQ